MVHTIKMKWRSWRPRGGCSMCVFKFNLVQSTIRYYEIFFYLYGMVSTTGVNVDADTTWIFVGTYGKYLVVFFGFHWFLHRYLHYVHEYWPLWARIVAAKSTPIDPTFKIRTGKHCNVKKHDCEWELSCCVLSEEVMMIFVGCVYGNHNNDVY